MAFTSKANQFVLNKNDIKSFPFQEYATLIPAEADALAERQSLTAFNLWMLPQLGALFGSYTLEKNDAGKYLPLAMLKKNMGNDAWSKGIYTVVCKMKRSSLVKAQANAQFAEYSALVPLILAGIKKYQNIPYSAWALEGLNHAVDHNLYEAMTCEYDGKLTPERLYELRVQGLTTKSGPKIGEIKKSTSSWCLTGVQGTEIALLPKLAQTMLTQIWVADSTIRNPYMILDPNDWDNMPDPLIKSDVVVAKKFFNSGTTYQHPEAGSNPWD